MYSLKSMKWALKLIKILFAEIICYHIATVLLNLFFGNQISYVGVLKQLKDYINLFQCSLILNTWLKIPITGFLLPTQIRSSFHSIEIPMEGKVKWKVHLSVSTT